VADRWHLLKNLREAIQHLFERHSAQLQEALAPSPRAATEELAKPQPALPKEVGRGEHSLAEPPQPPLPWPHEQARLASRQRRLERYQRVAELHRLGLSIRHIAKTLAMSRKAIRNYLRSGRCPDWQPGRQRPTRLDGFRAEVDQRIQEGCRNAAEQYRELVAKGCGASYDALRRFFTRRLAAVGQTRKRANAATPSTRPVPSARQLSFEVVRRPKKRTKEEQARLERLRRSDAELGEAIELAEEFAAMARKESRVTLTVWLAKASKSRSLEVRGFAEGLRQDEAAVMAALTEKWSNGPVEGQVNRLKVIKRQMYGRAGFQLLRVRVLHTG
jgi:transposase